MRGNLFVLAILVATPALVFSQASTPSVPDKPGKLQATITGCLTKSRHSTYRLVDQKGITNMVYSNTVHLDSYVGKSVTLVGDQSPTPSTDTGTARPMPHFKVLEVQPASGNCK